MTNAEKIYSRLTAAGMTPAGAAGTLGNLEAESALRANNLQDTYNKSLGMSDEAYTAAVDNGSYGKFQSDCAGYGLAQWTFWTRKRDLLAFAKDKGVSVGDVDMQADFIIYEMKRDYPGLWKTLTTTADVTAASNAVLTIYERPADMGAGVQSYRAGLARKWFDQLAGKKPEEPEETYWPPRMLCLGMSGPDVAAMRAVLTARGYACGVGEGFDEKTAQQVAAFQQSSGLAADKIAGPLTWAALTKI